MSRAIFHELTKYWEQLDEARVTHMAHPTWERRLFYSSMVSRYSHTVFHNLALGRGPLRAIIFRDAGVDALRLCRHGCVVDETLEHVCLQCPHVAGRRRAIDLALSDLEAFVPMLHACYS